MRLGKKTTEKHKYILRLIKTHSRTSNLIEYEEDSYAGPPYCPTSSTSSVDTNDDKVGKINVIKLKVINGQTQGGVLRVNLICSGEKDTL